MQRLINFCKNKYFVMAMIFMAVFSVGLGATNYTAHSANCPGTALSTPAFSVWPLTFDSNDTCKDLPLIDAINLNGTGRDARFSESQAEHDAGINAQNGDIIAVSLSYHNGASDQIDRSLTTAHGTVVSTTVNADASTTHTFAASIEATNAAGASSADHGGNITVHTATASTLQYVPGSTYQCIGYQDATDRGLDPSKYQACGVGPNGQNPIALPLPDGLFNGAVGIGDVKACFTYSGSVVYKVKVVVPTVVVNPPAPTGTAQLTITKQVEDTTTHGAFASTISASQNDHVQYQVVVTNVGSASATNVVVTDHGTGAVTADQPVFTSKNVGTLTAGQSTTIDYGGTVTVPSGTIINTAYVNATGLPQLSASADITVSKAVITPPPVVTGTPALSITKQVEDLTTHGAYAASITANQNDQVQYQVVVTNTGSANATNVVVTDHGTGAVTLNAPGFTSKTIGTLAVGASSTIDYSGEVTVPSGTIINTAYANATAVAQVSASASIVVNKITPPPVVTGTPALSITKVVEDVTTHGAYAASITANQNDQVQYQVTVKNTGSAVANNVVVTDPGTGAVTPSQPVFTSKNVGTLAVGASSTITYSGTVNIASGTIINTAYANATAVAQVSASASIVVNKITPPPVQQNAALQITKSVRDLTTNPTGNFAQSISNVHQNDTVEYQITVLNASSVTANAVVIRDAIPAGIQFVSGSADATLVGTGLAIGNLSPNQSKTVTFNATVTIATGTLLNTAYAQATNASEVSAQATIIVSLVPPVQIGSLSITKKVRNVTVGMEYATSLNALPNDTVGYLITVTNTSSITVNNVVINDSGVTGINFVTNPPYNLSAGNLAPGESFTVPYYTGTVGVNSGTLINTVTATASNASTVQAQATVIVTTPVVTPTATTLQITKTVRDVTANQANFASSTTANQNDTVAFQIVVTNTGSLTATYVTVSDALPTGLTYLSGLPNTDFLSSGFNAGNLNPGQSITYTFNAQVTTASATLVNTASAVASNAPQVNAQATVSVNTVIPLTYSATLTKGVRDLTQGQTAYVNNTNVYSGDTLEYQLVVTNTGTGSLTGVTLSDAMPSGITLDASSIGVSTGNNNVSLSGFTLPTIAPGQTVTVNYQAQVSTSTCGNLTNTATILGGSVNASATATVNLICQPQYGNITVTKLVENLTQNNSGFAQQTYANQGDRVAFQIQVTAQNAAATNVTVLDSFPANLTYATGSAKLNGATFTDGFINGTENVASTLNSGQTVTLYFEATVNGSLPYGQIYITNTVNASADHIGSVSANASVIVNNNAPTNPGYGQLSISKLVRNVSYLNVLTKNAQALPNDQVAYQITVINTGTESVTNAYVTDNLPAGLSYTNGSVTVDGSAQSDSLINGQLSLGTMLPGQQHVITFAATVTAQGGSTIQNIAEAGGQDVSTVQDTANIFVGSQVLGTSVNLIQSKRAFNDTKNLDATVVPASREDYITYTLSVVNTGNAPATSYVISDDLSNVLTYASVVDTNGGTVNGSVISWPSLTVPAGSSVQETFRVRVNYFLPSASNLSMTNTFGNTVTIQIQNPTVVPIQFVAPKTGAEATFAFLFAGLITAAVAILDKKGYFKNLLKSIPSIKIK